MVNHSTNFSPGQSLLSPSHLAMLRDESSISDEVILQRGYRTITDVKELLTLGFKRYQIRVPALLIPLYTTDGHNTLYTYRPDNPRVIEKKKRGKKPDGTYPCEVKKYENKAGEGIRLDCHPINLPKIGDPSIPIWITEGIKKGDCLTSHGLCAIVVNGVYGYKGKNSMGGVTFLADWDYISLKGRDVRVVYDSDVMSNPDVQRALKTLTEHLQRRGANVAHVYLPPGPNGEKVGVDNWFADGHTIDQLESMISGPKPEVKASPPTVELLDEFPNILNRPMMLFDGQSYAATWLPVRLTRHEIEKKGEIIKLAFPQIEERQQLFIIRSDGKIFSEIADNNILPLDELGMNIRLPDPPPPNTLWSPKGVKSYLKGERPTPKDIFWKVVSVIDRFSDFDRSLAPQRTMCEMLACYVIGTYCEDAFSVMPYLWFGGERGSGKTKIMLNTCQMSYLGMVILAGGTYPTLRDLADYGATLGFDDIENLADPKFDSDKRAIMLAGNRKGATISVKEQGTDKKWHTRYVNAFCPKLFTAIKLPDPVLSSRSIVIPLIRTPDRAKANADPEVNGLWPCDKKQLRDDLWGLGLAYLPLIPSYEHEVNHEARLEGRNLEPWRAILAIAKWLDDSGVSGLWQRIEQLSFDYQGNRPTLETVDLTALSIRAFCNLSIGIVHNKGCIPPMLALATSDVAAEVKNIITREDLDYDIDWVNSRKIGKKLSNLRFAKGDTYVSRGWAITPGDLQKLATTYAQEFPDELIDKTIVTPPPDVSDVSDVSDVTCVTSKKNDSKDSKEDIEPDSEGDDKQSSIHQTNVLNVSNVLNVRPKESCFHCGGNDWWLSPGKEWLCNTCHPKPK